MSFRNGLRQAQQQFARTQIRHNSTAQQQAKEKATAALNQAQAQATAALGKASKQAGEFVNKAKGYSSTFSKVWDCTVYSAKVSGNVAKEVYKREALHPPSMSQWEAAKQEFLKLANVETLKSLNKKKVLLGAFYATQIYGFFLVGEIIGRRNLVGYNV